MQPDRLVRRAGEPGPAFLSASRRGATQWRPVRGGRSAVALPAGNSVGRAVPALLRCHDRRWRQTRARLRSEAFGPPEHGIARDEGLAAKFFWAGNGLFFAYRGYTSGRWGETEILLSVRVTRAFGGGSGGRRRASGDGLSPAPAWGRATCPGGPVGSGDARLWGLLSGTTARTGRAGRVAALPQMCNQGRCSSRSMVPAPVLPIDTGLRAGYPTPANSCTSASPSRSIRSIRCLAHWMCLLCYLLAQRS
jgi:hypothetical protein